MHTGEGTGDNIGLANRSSPVRTAPVRVHITAIHNTTRSSSDDLPSSLYARYGGSASVRSSHQTVLDASKNWLYLPFSKFDDDVKLAELPNNSFE